MSISSNQVNKLFDSIVESIDKKEAVNMLKSLLKDQDTLKLNLIHKICNKFHIDILQPDWENNPKPKPTVEDLKALIEGWKPNKVHKLIKLMTVDYQPSFSEYSMRALKRIVEAVNTIDDDNPNINALVERFLDHDCEELLYKLAHHNILSIYTNYLTWIVENRLCYYTDFKSIKQSFHNHQIWNMTKFQTFIELIFRNEPHLKKEIREYVLSHESKDLPNYVRNI